VGASAWSRRVPYQADIAAALEQARADAYRENDFFRAEPDRRARELSEREYVAERAAALRESRIAAFGAAEADDDDHFELSEAWQAGRIEVTGPDSLLAAQPYFGAHSVIDMTEVGRRPADGRVTPLGRRVLRRWFGTRRPEEAAVERALRDGLNDLDRGHGAYVVAYGGDRPAWIYFFGASGD
jgi:hypothetical protein